MTGKAIFLCLGLFIVGLFFFGIWNSRNQVNKYSHPVAAPEIAPPAQPKVEERKSVTQPPRPKLSTKQIKQLTALRPYEVDKIAAINGILDATSFAARAEVYCRYYVDQSPSVPLPGIRSEKQAEERYAELMNAEPPTREEELRRQYQLRALGDRIAAFAQNVSMCQGMVTSGAQTIPGPDELRKHLIDAQQALAEIDRNIAPETDHGPNPPAPQAVKQPADTSQSPVAPQPSASVGAPAPELVPAPAPPVETAKPTSGVLCNGPVEVRQNWEFTFRNLPGGQLRFTFDHDAWLPLIHREPDGTQTVIMRSIKPGIQTKCDIRWEVVQ